MAQICYCKMVTCSSERVVDALDLISGITAVGGATRDAVVARSGGVCSTEAVLNMPSANDVATLPEGCRPGGEKLQGLKPLRPPADLQRAHGNQCDHQGQQRACGHLLGWASAVGGW